MLIQPVSSLFHHCFTSGNEPLDSQPSRFSFVMLAHPRRIERHRRCRTDKTVTWPKECKHCVAVGSPSRHYPISFRWCLTTLSVYRTAATHLRRCRIEPWPCRSSQLVGSIKFGSFNCRSAVKKAAAIHTIIDDHQLALQETSMTPTPHRV